MKIKQSSLSKKVILHLCFPVRSMPFTHTRCQFARQPFDIYICVCVSTATTTATIATTNTTITMTITTTNNQHHRQCLHTDHLRYEKVSLSRINVCSMTFV